MANGKHGNKQIDLIDFMNRNSRVHYRVEHQALNTQWCNDPIKQHEILEH